MKGEQIMRNVTLKVNGRKKPTEGEWFEVKPQDINQKLFRRKRKNEEQERDRKIIITSLTMILVISVSNRSKKFLRE